MASDLFQEQLTQFDSIRGSRGSHYELAKKCKAIGLFVDEETGGDDRLSLVKLQGCWNPDGSDTVIGQIVGDSAAVIE